MAVSKYFYSITGKDLPSTIKNFLSSFHQAFCIMINNLQRILLLSRVTTSTILRSYFLILVIYRDISSSFYSSTFTSFWRLSCTAYYDMIHMIDCEYQKTQLRWHHRTLILVTSATTSALSSTSYFIFGIVSISGFPIHMNSTSILSYPLKFNKIL